jgi:hypothetical protein
MNCPECRELLQRRLDGEVPGDAVAHHLNDCSECKAQFAAARRLEEGLRLLPAPVVPAGFAKRTVARVLAQRQARLRWRWATAAVALAASILVGLLVWNGAQQPPDEVPVAKKGPDTPQKSPVEQPVVKENPEKAPAPEPTLQETVQQTRLAMDKLANRLWDKTREHAAVWSDVTAPLEMGRVDFVSQRPTPPKAAPTKSGLATGVQTVAAVTKRGFGFLLRETPPLAVGAQQVVKEQFKEPARPEQPAARSNPE